MFIALAEVDTEYRPGGEERNAFYFWKRDLSLPVVVKITRLPPHFNSEYNWHRHKFVEEFSVPLTGEIIVSEEENGKVNERHLTKAILKKDEWIVGIECESTKRVTILIDSKSGNRREEVVEFLPEFTEGKNWHTVGNPTSGMVVMLTLKRVPRSIIKKDQMVFEVDRESRKL